MPTHSHSAHGGHYGRLLPMVVLSLKETRTSTTPHGREGFILAPCKACPRAFFPSGSIHGSRASFRVSGLNRIQDCAITGP